MKLLLLFLFTLTLSAQTQFGLPGDIPVPADYDGDGIPDLAVWRPSNGYWYIQPSTDPANTLTLQWGLPGDLPSSDGLTLTVFRPANGVWYKTPSPWRTQGPPNAPQMQVVLALPASCHTPQDSLVLLLIGPALTEQVTQASVVFYACDAITHSYLPLSLWEGLNSPGN